MALHIALAFHVDPEAKSIEASFMLPILVVKEPIEFAQLLFCELGTQMI